MTSDSWCLKPNGCQKFDHLPLQIYLWIFDRKTTRSFSRVGFPHRCFQLLQAAEMICGEYLSLKLVGFGLSLVLSKHKSKLSLPLLPCSASSGCCWWIPGLNWWRSQGSTPDSRQSRILDHCPPPPPNSKNSPDSLSTATSPPASPTSPSHFWFCCFDCSGSFCFSRMDCNHRRCHWGWCWSCCRG